MLIVSGNLLILIDHIATLILFINVCLRLIFSKPNI